MKTRLVLMSLCIAATASMHAQNYTSWRIGSADNLDVVPTQGTVLMGGASESDEAIEWFLERANGGDVLVMRASGNDGYNNYFFNFPGITLNSVETIRWENVGASTEAYVLQRIAEAEAIWIAGGNQANYVNWWKDTPVMEALNNHVNVKQGVIGGTSAGMAVLGGVYFSAVNGTVSSTVALNNPFANNVTLGFNDFIQAPFLQNVVTDTHYNNPDRKGRHMAFMARIFNDIEAQPYGIGANEYCAAAIDADGLARCFGDYLVQPQWDDDFVYFAQASCAHPEGPETIESGSPLTWNRSQEGVLVLRMPATPSGTNYLNLNDWYTQEGGSWFYWWAVNGIIQEAVASVLPDCIANAEDIILPNAVLYPNPVRDILTMVWEEPISRPAVIAIYDAMGRTVYQDNLASGALTWNMDASFLSPGFYIIDMQGARWKFIRE